MHHENGERTFKEEGVWELMNPFYVLYIAISLLLIYLFFRIRSFISNRKRLRIPSHNISNVSFDFKQGESHE